MNQKNQIICGIVAIGPNGVIGRDGSMPWISSQDLYHFKNKTMGFPCIFGKTTYDNLPIKPLPGRMNIVCSSSYNTEEINGCLRVPSLEEGLVCCGNTKQVFICGGAVLYKYALNKDLIDVMYITEIKSLDLAEEVKRNPNAFTYFLHKFEYPKWLKSRLNYPPHLLPKENFGTKAVFYKYTRLR